MADANPTLFVQLLLRHQDDLLRYVLPLVGRLDDAQDVIQETAAALWKKFAQYDAGQPFLPWAKRFARNEVLMHHRRTRRFTFLTEDLIDALAERSAGREALAEERRDALRHCVEKLPEADRALLDRHYAEVKTTVQELAAAAGTSANVLYKALARIRRQLLDCVGRALAGA